MLQIHVCVEGCTEAGKQADLVPAPDACPRAKLQQGRLGDNHEGHVLVEMIGNAIVRDVGYIQFNPASKVQKLKAEEPVAKVFRQHISPQPSGLGMTLAWHDSH